MPLPDHLRDLAARVSNWGRWGPDDRLGTLNLIDQAAVRRGLAAARQGRAFSLAIPFDEDGPQLGFVPGRVNPTRTMIAINESLTGDRGDFCSSDDVVEMGVQAATHWDALGHVGYDGLLYNGVPDTTIDETGSHEHGIERVGPLAARGVLLDLARTLGQDPLPGGHAITGDELDAAAARAGLTVESGDVVCLRTGYPAHLRNGDKLAYAATCAGPSTQSIEWFRDHDVAAVATDTLIFEVYPPEDPAMMLPVHMIHLRDMGLWQGQNFTFEELGADCEADGQHDFLLVATPVPLTRSVGGIVAPTAIK